MIYQVKTTYQHWDPLLEERLRVFNNPLQEQDLVLRASDKNLLEPCVLKRPALGIVGTRRPSSYGFRLMRRLFFELNKSPQKPTIVSGGALGIDALAHQGALKYNFPSFAWLVGPPERPTPSAHQNLFFEIMKRPRSGLLFPSELIPGPKRPLWKSFWIQRNRYIAASSDVLLVMEAYEKSGTWSTLKFALDFGVPVYAFSGDLMSPSSKGTNRMISRGYAHPVESFDDLYKRLLVDKIVTPYNKNRHAASGLGLV